MIKNNMRRKVACVLGCVMLASSMVACGGNGNDKESGKDNVRVVGEIAYAGASLENIEKTIKEKDKSGEKIKPEHFEDLNTMISALDSGKIDEMLIPSVTAQYLLKNNGSYEVNEMNTTIVVPVAMMLKSDNNALCEKINTARLALRENQEYIKLIKDMEENNTKVEFEHFDGAETITFAVTGDIPPMDYVDADGKPSGYNMRYIAAICKKMKVNAKIIQISSGARAMALSTGKADVVFWTKGQIGDEYLESVKEAVKSSNGQNDAGIKALFNSDGTINKEVVERSNELNKMDQPENTISTIPFFTDVLVSVKKK